MRRLDNTSVFEPFEEFRGGPQAGVYERLRHGNWLTVIEHDVVSTRHAHEVVATGGRQQKHEIVGGVLIGDRVIRVADVTSIGSPNSLQEVIFRPARIIWRSSYEYSGPMKPTTLLTGTGRKRERP